MATVSSVIWDPEADVQLTQHRIYISGPRRFIADTVAGTGWAINLGAYGEIAADLYAGAPSLTLSGGTPASFPVQGGYFYAIGDDGGDNWFSYTYRRNLVLYGIARVSGTSLSIPASWLGGPNRLQLWRDCSAFLTTGRKGFAITGSSAWWTLTLNGAQWNSLIFAQHAGVRLYQRYRNSTSNQWTDWEPRFQGYFDPIKESYGNQSNQFQVTATGQVKYLRGRRLPAQVMGCERITPVYSGSPILTEPALEPDEGRPPVNFQYTNLGDQDRLTACATHDIPIEGDPLPGPTGVPQANPPIPKRNYQKIQQVFCAARQGARLTRAEQFWLEVANGMKGQPPDQAPWVDDPGTPWLPTDDALYRPPKKASLTPEQWQTLQGAGQATGEFVIEFWPSGVRLYVGKDDADKGITLGPQSTCIFTYDRQIYEQNFRSTGETVIELKGLDGWAPGMWMNERRHGMGSTINPDPAAGGILLRTGSKVKADGNPLQNSMIAADTATAANNWRGTITLDDASAFSVRGEGDVETTGCTLRWNGKSGNTLLNVEKGGKDGNRNGPTAGCAGLRLNQSFFSGWYLDAVFWGATTPPSAFLYETNTDTDPQGNIYDADGNVVGTYPTGPVPTGDALDQNTKGLLDQVWGKRDDPTTVRPFTVPGRTVAPNGIPENASIRRKHWAGGNLANRPDDTIPDEIPGPFSGWDGGTADDWEVVSPPLPGNLQGVLTEVHFLMQLPEHPAATVVSDLVDTLVAGSPPGGAYYQTLTVNPDGAWEYPPKLGVNEGLYVDGIFLTYESRDRSTFYGCRKYDIHANPYDLGAGPLLSVGATLTEMIDLNPDWRADEQGPRSPRNLYALAGISWEHEKVGSTATVVLDDSRVSHILQVGNGQATRWPASGAFTCRSQDSKYLFTFNYGRHDANAFYDVFWESTDPEGNPSHTLQPGQIITSVSQAPSYPAKWSIHASRLDSPIPFNSSYGTNPDWQEIVGSGRSRGPREVVDITGTGHTSRWKWVVLVVWAVQPRGRLILTDLALWRQPKAASGPVNVLTMLQGGYSYGDIANELLDQLDVDEQDRRISRRGPLVRTLPLAEDNGQKLLDDLAGRAGYLVVYDKLDIVNWIQDPHRPGAPIAPQPVITLNAASVKGTFQAEELPNLVVSQVRLIATNPLTNETYDVVTPPQPYEWGGEPKVITGRFAASEQDAYHQAANELATSNGGHRLRVPIGHFDEIEAYDFARVDLPKADQAGREFNETMIITGGEWEFSRLGGQTGTLTVQTFKKA